MAKGYGIFSWCRPIQAEYKIVDQSFTCEQPLYALNFLRTFLSTSKQSQSMTSFFFRLIIASDNSIFCCFRFFSSCVNKPMLYLDNVTSELVNKLWTIRQLIIFEIFQSIQTRNLTCNMVPRGLVSSFRHLIP